MNRSCLIAVLCLAALLSGCSGERLSDLHRWVHQVERRPAGRLAPLPKIPHYGKFTYSAYNLPSPFDPARLIAGTKRVVHHSSGIHPDFSRPKGPLQGYPLDSLKMVGTLQMHGRLWGLVKIPGGMIYPVHLGDYMGRHYGKVIKIGQQDIELTELVPDGMGGWLKQPAALALK